MSQKIVDSSCEGCYYCGSAGGLKTCDYIFIADRRRPCPAGAGCTVHGENHQKGNAYGRTKLGC